MAIATIVTIIIIICKLFPSCGPKHAMTPQSHSGLMLHTVSGQGTVHHMTAQSLSSLMQHTDGNGSHLVLQQGSSSLLQH